MTAVDPAVAGLRETAGKKRRELEELTIAARTVYLTIRSETARHNAMYDRIRSLRLELQDLAELTGRKRR